ncbi:MAG: sporulation protein YtxC [Bacillota bacterium]|nr:sporulation protein YtxC [Bacillota bacterium]
MELLSLELNINENKEIINNIKIITNLDESDIDIEISSVSDNNLSILYSTNDKLNKKKYLEKIIGKITKLITEFIKHESKKYFEENYFYFDEGEFGQLQESIEDEIENDIKIQLVVKNKLKEILENSKTINLNGFIKFRLKFINLYVSQIVEKSIDSFLMKQEYLDFLNIINYISETESKENDLVNIMYIKDKLQLYDSKMKKLNYISNVEISQELDGKVLIYDEFIVNVLLNISPKKIILHLTKVKGVNMEAKNTIDLIKRIFEGKVEICNGCKFCELE